MQLSPPNYYLVDKDWLDQYKEKNNYKTECEKFKNFDFQDYDSFKLNIKNEYSIDENNFTNDDVEKIQKIIELNLKRKN